MNIRPSRATALAAATLLLGGVAATTSLATESPQKPPTVAPTPPSASQASASQPSRAAQAATPTPTQFVMQAAEGGLAEVQISKLAQAQSQSAVVQQFARRMISDHGKANTELQEIARRKNLKLPTELNAEHDATLRKLQALKGAEFDAAYMAAMDKDHRKSIALFESASGSNFQDPDLQAFAAKTLPVIQEHHQMIERTMPTSQASR
jgi:putative membrane protein